MKWTVRLSRGAAKQLERASDDQQELLFKRLDELAEDPFRGDVKPLKGPKWHGRYRKRAGRWRIIFTATYPQRLVEVSAILLRSEKTYR